LGGEFEGLVSVASDALVDADGCEGGLGVFLHEGLEYLEEGDAVLAPAEA
jgi:hypothetical protein